MSWYRIFIAGLLAVGLAFGIAIPLGFWLRPRFPAITDEVFGAMLAALLVGIAAGVMFLLAGPLWPARKVDLAAGRHTGYELSCEDFCSLMRAPSTQAVVAPLLRDWYHYEIVGQGSATVVRSEDGSPVDLRHLHNRIQIDPTKQYTVYQRVMGIWR